MPGGSWVQLQLTDKATIAVRCKATLASWTTVSPSQDAFLCHVNLAKMRWWVRLRQHVLSLYRVKEPSHVKHWVSGLLLCRQLPREETGHSSLLLGAVYMLMTGG